MKKPFSNELKFLKTLSKKKGFWVIGTGLVIGVCLLYWQWKRSKSITAVNPTSTTTASLSSIKLRPEYTILCLDALYGFNDDQISINGEVVSAPYLEKEINFAASVGLDAIIISVPIDHVFKSDGTTNWKGVEHCVNYAADKDLFVITKLQMLPRASYLYPSFNLTDFVSNQSSVKFSSAFWTGYAAQFAKEYKEKFGALHASGHILCVAPTSNAQQEWGYESSVGLFETNYGQRIRQTVAQFNALVDILSPLEVMMDTGSAYDELAASGRGTSAFADFNGKWWKQNPHHSYDAKFDAALGLTTARAKGGFYMVEWTNTPHGQVTPMMTQHIQQSTDAGCDMVGLCFIEGEAGHEVVTDVVRRLKESGHYRKTKSPWTPTNQVSYTTAELAANNGYTGAILTRFNNSIAANGGKLPSVTVTNNL